MVQWMVLMLLDAEFLVNMSASADVLAMAKVEVDLNAIPEGKNVSPPKHEELYQSTQHTHLTCQFRSLSSGVASPSSSDTEPRRKSTPPTRSTFLACETPSPMTTVSRSPSGLSCWVRIPQLQFQDDGMPYRSCRRVKYCLLVTRSYTC